MIFIPLRNTGTKRCASNATSSIHSLSVSHSQVTLVHSLPCRAVAVQRVPAHKYSGGLVRLPACPMASGPLKQKTIWAPRKCGREKKILFSIVGFSKEMK
ncbi:hypothetical protein AVEN_102135-1 [Araneus ventricosus]|uniref:Uncharacterized protein n=1 Tax=Araneus ventricosus TaxID=182803 RepID=A0A4Y2TBN8_ARAVE|nr:hypothetical protein AVEN_102135-1 [Araneus ventricosus]